LTKQGLLLLVHGHKLFKGLGDKSDHKSVGELARVLLTFKRPICRNITDYWQFSLGVGLRQMLFLPEF